LDFWVRFYGGRKGKISPALVEAFGEGEKKKVFGEGQKQSIAGDGKKKGNNVENDKNSGRYLDIFGHIRNKSRQKEN
jgi:hypothetical protein